MGYTSEGSLNAPDDYRNIRIYLLKYLCVDSNSIIRSLTGLALRSICIVAPEALGGSIMVHHRVHGSAVDSEIKSRSSQLLEITEIVAPVRLRYDCHPVSMFLQPAGNYSRSE